MQQLRWDNKANGVWKTQIGTEDFLDLLSQSGASPRMDSLEKMSIQAFPLAEGEISVTEAGDKLVLTLPLERGEKLYGLGLNFGGLEVQKSIRHLHVDHFGGKDNGRTHAPVPFYVSEKGYGVFVNLARYISVYAGGTHRKENHPPVIDRQSGEWQDVQSGRMVEIVVPAPGAEIVVFAGSSMLEVVRRFNLYCGGGCLPARHGLGFWHRVPMTFADRDASGEADEFSERGFPLDECDGYDQWIWPDHATFPSGLSGEQLRQVYGLLFQRTTTEMYRERNRRTYGLVRASNAGSVSLPYVIYNDYYEHRGFITALCS